MHSSPQIHILMKLHRLHSGRIGERMGEWEIIVIERRGSDTFSTVIDDSVL